MFKLDLEKEEELEIKLPTSDGSQKKEERSRGTSTSALLTMPIPSPVWIIANCGKFLKRWEYQTALPNFLLGKMYAGKEAKLELDLEQWTDSKLERHNSKLYIVTLPI